MKKSSKKHLPKSGEKSDIEKIQREIEEVAKTQFIKGTYKRLFMGSKRGKGWI